MRIGMRSKPLPLWKPKRRKPVSEGSHRNRILIKFILDESGSMGAVKSETILGFNKYINDLKSDTCNDYVVSLITFSNSAKTVFSNKLLSSVPCLSSCNYQPSGWTALYDAVGLAITSEEPTNADKVLVVIMTDGEENYSKKFSSYEVKRLIQEKECEGNWTFVYLGAVADAWGASARMGICKGNTARFDVNYMGTTMSNLWTATQSYACSSPGSASKDFYGGKTDMSKEDK